MERAFSGQLALNSTGITEYAVDQTVLVIVAYLHLNLLHMTILYGRAQHGADKIECPVPGCGSKFNAESYLAIHRKKMHGEHKSEVGEHLKMRR